MLCKLGFHRWKYKRKGCGDPMFDLLFWTTTRYCERCERIERADVIASPWIPIIFKKVNV